MHINRHQQHKYKFKYTRQKINPPEIESEVTYCTKRNKKLKAADDDRLVIEF